MSFRRKNTHLLLGVTVRWTTTRARPTPRVVLAMVVGMRRIATHFLVVRQGADTMAAAGFLVARKGAAVTPAELTPPDFDSPSVLVTAQSG